MCLGAELVQYRNASPCARCERRIDPSETETLHPSPPASSQPPHPKDASQRHHRCALPASLARPPRCLLPSARPCLSRVRSPPAVCALPTLLLGHARATAALISSHPPQQCMRHHPLRSVQRARSARGGPRRDNTRIHRGAEKKTVTYWGTVDIVIEKVARSL